MSVLVVEQEFSASIPLRSFNGGVTQSATNVCNLMIFCYPNQQDDILRSPFGWDGSRLRVSQLSHITHGS
jgi:hypothetical protein